MQTIITGSWYPRTRFHIKEWRDFLVDGTANPDISVMELKKTQRKLMPEGVDYIGLSEGGRFDRVVAELDGFATSFFEDGLMLVEKKVEDLDKDYKDIHKFYVNKLSPALRLIYSIGVPTITFRGTKERVRATIFVSKKASQPDIESLLKDYEDELVHVSKNDGHTIYFANHHVIIVTNGSKPSVTEKVITSIIFFKEYEGRLNNFLNLHRKVWTNIQEIREKKRVKLSELPGIRDTLLDNQRDLSIVKARLEQMRDYLAERKLEIDEIGLEKHLRALEVYRYGKMNVNSLYINRLWGMLEDYIGSSLKIVDLMYQENVQRQFNIQQFIFLIGAIGGILALGKLSNERLTMFTESGAMAYGGALVLFGSAALLISIVVFVLIKNLLPKITGIRTGHLFGTKKLLQEEKPE